MANYQSIHTGDHIDYVVSNALLKTDAASTYLTKTDASATYLTKTDASNIYLTKTDASNIYLTKTDANSLYPTKLGGGASGTWSISINGNAATSTKAIQDNLGNIINTYYTPISYMPLRSLRDFTSGTLITTNLDGGQSNSSVPFLLRIVGNGYGNGIVICYAQGYVYHLGNGYNTYISIAAVSLGNNFANKIYAFRDSNGYLAFWIERMAYWQGFDVQCWNCSENINTHNMINHVTSITNSGLPSSRSYTTEITVTKK